MMFYWNGQLVCTPAPRTLFARPAVHVTSDVITYHCCAV